MQLEQIMYQPMQMQRTAQEPRERVYTAVDLEYLSAGALYSSGPLSGSGPLRFESSGPLGFGSMSIFDKMDDFVKLSRPLEPIPLRLEGGPRGLKILEDNYPLVRIDYPAHGSKPPMHLQYGSGHESSGRSGNNAADILAEILKLNTKIKFPGIKD